MKLTQPLVAIMCALALVLSACGGSGGDTTGETSPDTTSVGSSDETTTSQTSDSGGDATTSSSGVFEELVGDLPKPCEFISADEMSTVLGVEVTSEEAYGSDCFYTPVAGYGAGFEAHTSALAFLPDECEYLLQTEAILPHETVEPAEGYGDLASIISTPTSTQIQVCSPTASITVTVSGSENDPVSERLAAAQQIVDLILAGL